MSPPVSRRVAGGLVHDREAQPVVGIAERDEVSDLHRAGPATGGLEVRPEEVGPDQEVLGVRLGAEPVVRHGEELPGAASVDDRRETLDRLRGPGEHDPVEGGQHAGARGRAGGQGVGRQDGAADQSRLVGRGVCRARRAGGDEAAHQGGDREKKGGAGDERPASDRSQRGAHDYSCWAAERVQNTDWRSRGRRPTETPVTTTGSSQSQTCGVQRCCQPAPVRRSWHPPRRPPVSSGRPQGWPAGVRPRWQ